VAALDLDLGRYERQLREQGFRAVLDAPGWTVSATEADDDDTRHFGGP